MCMYTSYRMLVYMLEMTFHSQTRLTPGEQVTNCRMALCSRISRHCTASRMAAAGLTHFQSYRRVYGALHHIRNTVQINLLPVTVVWYKV
jgi:hypothetical protein